MNLKVLVGAVALASLGLFAACAPDAVNNDTPNALVVAPSLIHLDSKTDTVASNISLTCGCRFIIDSIRYVGDTNDIHYKLNEPLSQLVKPHTVSFYLDANAPAGSYATAFEIYVLDDNNITFRDTINVTAP